MGECLDGLAMITSKELAITHFVKCGTLQNACSTRPRMVMRVKSVGSCHECFEFGTKWDIGCVHRNHSARGWSYAINRCGRTSYRLHRGRQNIEGVRVRLTGTAAASSRTRSVCIESENTATEILSSSHTHCWVNGIAADDPHRRRHLDSMLLRFITATFQ